MAEFVDYINMNLSDPAVTPHNGTKQNVEPGTYGFEITKAVFDQSRKGNRTLRVTGSVCSDDPMKGRSLTHSYVISDEDFARRRMKNLIESTGAQLDASGGFSREALVGLKFTADVIIETFDDIDPKTGSPTTREITKWVGERTYEGAADAPAVVPVVTAPAGRGRPTAPANGAAARTR